MAKVNAQERGNNFGMYGRIGQGYQYGRRIYGKNRYANQENSEAKANFGLRIYGDFEYGDGDNLWGIYQRRHNKGKVVYARLKFYIPKNPRTAPQQSHRAKFTAGMTAWANLTENEKASYNERAKSLSLHGVNLYMREYLKSN